MNIIHLTLPLPPSKNDLHVPGVHKVTKKLQTYRSTEARAWYRAMVGSKRRPGYLRELVGLMRKPWAWAYQARLHVEYTVHERRAGICDVHNLEEALFDALERAGLIENDRRIDSHVGRRGPADPHGRVEVVITETETLVQERDGARTKVGVGDVAS